MAILKIKVVPGARQCEIVGWLGERLKIRVTAAPEKGEANKQVIRLLCDTLGLPVNAVKLSAGTRSPLKTITIDGLSTGELAARLGERS